MALHEYSGQNIEVDDEGYLVESGGWNEEVAQFLAEREGFPALSAEQLDILQFIREYYRKYNFFPILHAVCKNIHQPKDCVQEEFMSPLKAWKIAGLPKPDEIMTNLLEHGETPG